MPVVEISAIAVIFVLAGVAKGVVGFGLPAVGIGLMALFMPPADAAALMVVPGLVTNLWQAGTGPHLGAVIRRYWPMQAAVLLGIWAGAGTIAGSEAALAAGGLGLALSVYAVLGLAEVRFHVPTRVEPVAGPIAGLATGLVTAATGIFVIPSGPYLQATGLDRDALIQAMGMTFTVSTAGLAVTLADAGVLDGETGLASGLALLPAMLGVSAGTYLRQRIPPRPFRRVFFAGLLLLGLQFVAKLVG